MSKTFPQESSEAFLNLKSLHWAEQKKIHQRFSTECFEKHFEKRTSFHLASQKKNLLELSHLFWISLWVSWQNHWKKQFIGSA